uniref:helix-turn-helix transcriptional regulator n=1 Tax=Vibrio harveyi TaxID=669 RepID=UPI000ADA3BF8
LIIRGANDALCQTFSVRREEYVQKNALDLVRSSDYGIPMIGEFLCDILKQKRTKHFLYVANVSGRKSTFVSRAMIINNLDGNTIGLEVHLVPFSIVSKFINSFMDVRLFGKDDSTIKNWGENTRFTKRQDELLFMLNTGYSNAEIAKALGLSHKTVDNTFLSIRKKILKCEGIELSSRDELRQWCLGTIHGVSLPDNMFRYGIIPLNVSWEYWEKALSQFQTI